MRIESLTSQDRQTLDFWRLLWWATGYDDARLRSVRDEQLSESTVLGAKDDNGVVAAFVAYRVDDSAVVIEYIATAEQQRGKGIGTTMIETVRLRHPGMAILAQTDDDAVGFYSSLGFHTRPVRNPQCRQRQRYECRLPAYLKR